jgi:hypothetical protein
MRVGGSCIQQSNFACNVERVLSYRLEQGDWIARFNYETSQREIQIPNMSCPSRRLATEGKRKLIRLSFCLRPSCLPRTGACSGENMLSDCILPLDEYLETSPNSLAEVALVLSTNSFVDCPGCHIPPITELKGLD